MVIAIVSSLLFVFISVIMRFVYYRFPIDKVKASWIAFFYAVLATTISTLISGGQQQSTLITGFATMLLCYTILTFQPYKL
ncbi:hypothetical protein IKE67_02795 [bacterium]|nr:hypothetical protein [bacterium]